MVMMCYQTNNLVSFNNVKSIWVEEFQKSGIKCPVVLVEMQIDNPPKIAQNQLDELYASTAELYDEYKISCSAKEGDGITDAFYKVVEVWQNRAVF